MRAVVTDDPDFAWSLPPADEPSDALQHGPHGQDSERAQAGQQERVGAVLIEALGHFGVEAKMIGTVSGPHITRYELRLAPGTKVAKVAQLKDDLAYALAATDIRILAPIPGKQAVGVEVPNARRRIVRLGDVYQAPPKDWSPLTVWLGKDVAGKAIGADLAKMPHLLVAGATGSGKSGAINAMLSSVLLRATPHEVRVVLVDPKQVELNHYESIPHLLTPVITNPRMAANALANLVREMEQRYGIMSLARTRSLPELNAARRRRGRIRSALHPLRDRRARGPDDGGAGRRGGLDHPAGPEGARGGDPPGAGHAEPTRRRDHGHDQGQRPLAHRLRGLLADRLARDPRPERRRDAPGPGRPALQPDGLGEAAAHPGRIHRRGQIAKITDYWRRQGEPELREELLEQVEESGGEEGSGDELDPDQDPLLRDAITLVAEMQTASTSMMQRRLRVGYTRAGRLIDMLERRGVISGYEGSKPRQVLISESDLPRVLAMLDEDEQPYRGRGARRLLRGGPR